jgi:L-asparaginase/Glu-tRNA(Gln) amidotransferase subunit D
MTLGLLNCGGTITERYVADGRLERLTADELVRLTGENPAGWVAQDVEQVDSSELGFASVCKLRAAMRADRESTGFVVCCGTDAMEDVAYAAALLLDRDRPVVLTGSALPGGHLASDGPSNLMEAALLARAMPAGSAPLVAFAGRAFDPQVMVKHSPQAMQPFGPETAVRGTIEAGLVTLTGGCTVSENHPDIEASDLASRVAIVTQAFGAAACFPDPAQIDALVFAGNGAGGFPRETGAILQDFAARMPVVLSTRCAGGFRVNPAIAKHAALEAGTMGLTLEGYEGLNAAKARIRLIVELGRIARDRRHQA